MVNMPGGSDNNAVYPSLAHNAIIYQNHWWKINFYNFTNTTFGFYHEYSVLQCIIYTIIVVAWYI